MNKLVVRALRLLLPLALLLGALSLLGGPRPAGVERAAPPTSESRAPFVRRGRLAAKARKENAAKPARPKRRRAADEAWRPPGDPVLRARWKRRLMEDCDGVEDEGFVDGDPDEPPSGNRLERLTLRTICRYVRLHARLPPPGFEGWVSWADKHRCELDHYPAIERDLKPYRVRYKGRADLLRRVVGALMEQEEHAKHYLRIRNGSVFTWGEGAEVTKVPIAKFAWALPDMDMIVNWLDEPRVLAWEDSQRALTDTEADDLSARVDWLYNVSRLRMFHDDRTVQLPPLPNASYLARFPPTPPDDPSGDPIPFDPRKPIPFHDYASKDIRPLLRERCPPLRTHPAAERAMSLHGFFLAPTSFKPAYTLIPVFTATKPWLGARGSPHDEDAVSCFQDIILPNHLSLRTKTPPGMNPPPWNQRKPKMIWRGRSTGGQLTASAPWRDFQRPRAVELSNRLMAQGKDLVDLQFTDVIQCDDGRGGRGGYFERIDFDYRAEGDEEALENLLEELSAERRGTQVRPKKANGTAAFDPDVPDGRDEEEWKRDRVGERLRGALEKLRRERKEGKGQPPNEAGKGEGEEVPVEPEDAGEGMEGAEEDMPPGEAEGELPPEDGRGEPFDGDAGGEGDVPPEPEGEEPPPARRRLHKRQVDEGPVDGAPLGPLARKDRQSKGKPDRPPAKGSPPGVVPDGAAPGDAATRKPISRPPPPNDGAAAEGGDEAQRPVLGRFRPGFGLPSRSSQPEAPADGPPLKKRPHPLLRANVTALNPQLRRHPPPPVPPPRKRVKAKNEKRVNMCALVKNFYGTGNWMGTGECLGYKYLFDVDGNTWSQRFETFLWGGSLVFRMSLFSNWFDQYILPDVHYIHLNVTLSDLESRLAWAMKHDAEAERMARKAAEVAAARLRIADMECYLYRLLLEYAQLGEEVYLGDD